MRISCPAIFRSFAHCFLLLLSAQTDRVERLNCQQYRIRRAKYSLFRSVTKSIGKSNYVEEAHTHFAAIASNFTILIQTTRFGFVDSYSLLLFHRVRYRFSVVRRISSAVQCQNAVVCRLGRTMTASQT